MSYWDDLEKNETNDHNRRMEYERLCHKHRMAELKYEIKIRLMEEKGEK